MRPSPSILRSSETETDADEETETDFVAVSVTAQLRSPLRFLPRLRRRRQRPKTADEDGQQTEMEALPRWGPESRVRSPADCHAVGFESESEFRGEDFYRADSTAYRIPFTEGVFRIQFLNIVFRNRIAKISRQELSGGIRARSI
jgi:hypothetical protein